MNFWTDENLMDYLIMCDTTKGLMVSFRKGQEKFKTKNIAKDCLMMHFVEEEGKIIALFKNQTICVWEIREIS